MTAAEVMAWLPDTLEGYSHSWGPQLPRDMCFIACWPLGACGHAQTTAAECAEVGDRAEGGW